MARWGGIDRLCRNEVAHEIFRTYFPHKLGIPFWRKPGRGKGYNDTELARLPRMCIPYFMAMILIRKDDASGTAGILSSVIGYVPATLWSRFNWLFERKGKSEIEHLIVKYEEAYRNKANFAQEVSERI